MKTFTRKTIGIIAATLALAAAGAGVVVAQASPRHGGMHGHGGPMAMDGGPWMARGLDRMLDGVDASAEQRQQIRAIAEAARKDMGAEREAAQSLREQAVALFTQPTVDANAAEALRQQMMARHERSSQRMLQAMLEASRVLTPEQRTQLAGRMKQRQDMMQRHQRERRALDKPTS